MYCLLLKKPLKVQYQTKDGMAEKEFPAEALLPILRVYEPKKPMHRKFPYDVYLAGVGMRRMGRNSEAYELVEVTDDNELSSGSVGQSEVGNESLPAHEARDGDEPSAEAVQSVS